MRLGLVFAGQGAERPGMGIGWVSHPRVAEASELLGLDLAKLLKRGGPRLHRTEVLQPALVALGLAAVDTLRQAGATWSVCAGHSLGEWTAWSAAGGIDASAVLELVVHRARAMADAARGTPGGMVRSRAREGLTLAIDDDAERPVFSGPEAAIRRAVAQGGRRLPVTGPWHSGAMAPARAALESRMPHSGPTSAALILADRGRVEPDERIAEALLNQLVGTARWRAVVDTLRGFDVDAFVAIVPGRSIARSLRAVVRPVHRLEDPSDLEAILGT